MDPPKLWSFNFFIAHVYHIGMVSQNNETASMLVSYILNSPLNLLFLFSLVAEASFPWYSRQIMINTREDRSLLVKCQKWHLYGYTKKARVTKTHGQQDGAETSDLMTSTTSYHVVNGAFFFLE